MNPLIRRMIDPTHCRTSLKNTKLVLKRAMGATQNRYLFDHQLTHVDEQRKIRNLCEKAINLTKEDRLYVSWDVQFSIQDSVEEHITIESENLDVRVQEVIYKPLDHHHSVLIDVSLNSKYSITQL